jgi:cell division protein FtsI/penicillin-binding protein 2
MKPGPRTKQERLRLGIIVLAVGLFVGIVAARLGYFQIVQHSRYHGIVMRQSSGTVGIPAPRGVVYDRRGQTVAKNIIAKSLYAYPVSRSQVNRVAAYVESLLDLPKGAAVRKYSLKSRRFSWIQRAMDDDLAARIEKEAPPGLHLREEQCRSYPYASIGRQILGFTDIDNRGQSGIELSCDSILAGDSGVADIRRDGLRNTYRVHESALISPNPGKALVLTVDWRFQDIVEDELQKAVRKHNAQYGMAAFLDCHTGEILAIAHFDPKETNPERPTKLRAVADWFEPGSVFKPFVAAGLLDAGLVDYQDTTYCEMGKWKVGRRILHDDKELEWLTFREIIEYSSNIGIGKYATQLGGDGLVASCRRFGFGQKLRSGLPGESAGRLANPGRWSDYTIAALAMGHSIAVTTLHMAAAFGAIANGGDVYRPHIVLGMVNGHGQLIRRGKPDLISRGMGEDHVDSLHAFLRGVVEHGTAEPVNSPIIAIAGKTGTGEIPDLKTGRMLKNRYVGSFGGFFPAEKPQIAGIVVIVDPRRITYGGHTAGPAYRKMAERFVVMNPDRFGLSNRTLAERESPGIKSVEAPDLMGRDVELARELAVRAGLDYRTSGDRGAVVWQFPPPDRLVLEGDHILVAVAENEEGVSVMPDLQGLPVRTAAAFMSFAGLPFRVQGSGIVSRQRPRAGEPVDPSIVSEFFCRRKPGDAWASR